MASRIPKAIASLAMAHLERVGSASPLSMRKHNVQTASAANGMSFGLLKL